MRLDSLKSCRMRQMQTRLLNLRRGRGKPLPTYCHSANMSPVMATLHVNNKYHLKNILAYYTMHTLLPQSSIQYPTKSLRQCRLCCKPRCMSIEHRTMQAGWRLLITLYISRYHSRWVGAHPRQKPLAIQAISSLFGSLSLYIGTRWI